MNKQEIEKAICKLDYAVELIGDYEVHTNTDGIEEAIDLAKETLTQQLTNGWILVDSRLPEIHEYREPSTRELIPLLVCIDGTEYPFRAFFDGKGWGDGISRLDVIAWRSLPEPHRKEKPL